MSRSKGSIINGPNEISYESTVKIKEQMEKNICKIDLVNRQGTGFFCKIPFPNKDNMLSVLITNNHIIDEKMMEDGVEFPVTIKEKKDNLMISLKNRIKYTNQAYDTTIIEIKKEEEEIINNYLELDDKIIDDIIKKDNKISEYVGETIYIIQYPNGKLSVSYGILIDILKGDQQYNFHHKCCTDGGSSGSPILNENNKAIGVHKEVNRGNVNYNVGSFLNFPIKDFILKNYKDKIYNKSRNTKIDIIKKPSEYPKEITFKCTKKILEQMENNICQILIGKKQATGFFCEIPFPDRDNILDVLITTDIIHNEKTIPVIFQEKNEKNKKLEIILNNKIKTTFEKFNMSIIEIKKEDNIKNFLELDDLILDDINKDNVQYNKYKDKTIYIPHYPDENLSVSYGIISDIPEENKLYFQHKCITNIGSSGSPILNLNNKVIGIHKEYNNHYNKGIFLNQPIKEFIQQNSDYIKHNNNSYNNNKIQNYLFQEFKMNYNYKNNSECSEVSILNFTGNKPSLKDDGLNSLCEINFNNLKKLILFSNKISNIEPLKKAKFYKLKELSLNNNNISDISFLSKVNFKNLEVLNLGSNRISDINVLKNVEFNDLKELYLDDNKISDINVLDKVNFEELKTLKLYGNEISDIDVFENSNFPELKNLNLARNKISNIDSLGKSEFKTELKELFLNHNPDIKDINALINLENLKVLYVLMQNNKIDRGKCEKTINYFRKKKEDGLMDKFQ